MPPPPSILDAHIHLWPSTATSPKDHTWMTSPAHPLAKQHSVAEYLSTTSSSPVPPKAFIYVETDRHLPSASPPSSLLAPSLPRADLEQGLRSWARAPLEELAFLRRVVEGSVEEGDGAGRDAGEMVAGLVVWAPFHLPPGVFEAYLEVARGVLGERAWARVVGFRYLLQGRGVEEVRRLVGVRFVENVRRACEGEGGEGRTFDVGVDAHRDGVEVLGVVEELVGALEGVGVVLSESCFFSFPFSGCTSWVRCVAGNFPLCSALCACVLGWVHSFPLCCATLPPSPFFFPPHMSTHHCSSFRSHNPSISHQYQNTN